MSFHIANSKEEKDKREDFDKTWKNLKKLSAMKFSQLWAILIWREIRRLKYELEQILEFLRFIRDLRRTLLQVVHKMR